MINYNDPKPCECGRSDGAGGAGANAEFGAKAERVRIGSCRQAGPEEVLANRLRAIPVGDSYTGATPPDRYRGVARHGAKQGSDGPDERLSQLDMIGAPSTETAAADIT
jgi:hypothetical protein